MSSDKVSDLLALITRAANEHDVEAVLDLSTVLKRWKSDEASLAGDGGRKVASTVTPAASKREALQWAKKTKAEYALRHGLRHRSRAIFSSPRGSTVGIAASRWRRGEPTCFLGLSENLPESWDVVVLLCEVDGRTLDFAIPLVDIKDIWSSLSRSAGQVKFHIQRDLVGCYQLRVPGGAPVNLERYFGAEPEI